MAKATTSSATKVRPVDADFKLEQPMVQPDDEQVPAENQAPIKVQSAPAATRSKGGIRRLILPVMILAALGAGGWYGYEWWTTGRFMVSTDDAYIQGSITSVAPKVTGYVAKVNVSSNQHVKAGDPLVTLDNGDYQIAVSQAEAQIATQKLALNRFDAQIDAAKASLSQAEAQKTALTAALAQTAAQKTGFEATLRGAVINEKRASDLAAKSAGTLAARDSAVVALDQAKANILGADSNIAASRANLVGADSNIAAATANIAVVTAQRAEAESTIHSLELQRDKALRDLSFTVLKAPFDGVIGNMAVQTGDLVTPGERLASLVPVSELYIEANFKETQVSRIKPGAKVSVHVDALGDKVIEGTVESIAPASGAVFSLLPPENATGNFTKVIQRLPVRISLPKGALETGDLRAGLSVVVDIDSRTGRQNGIDASQTK